ncbi:hypothetical protein ABIE16_002433 [Pseudomonas sp. 2725]|jgi:hypothetical protein
MPDEALQELDLDVDVDVDVGDTMYLIEEFCTRDA